MDIGLAPKVAASAAVFADPARTTILLALATSGPQSVTDLATTAGISLSTASTHLRKLASAGLVASVRAGRLHRYRLNDTGVTVALEALASMAPTTASRRRRTADPAPDHVARTCYDHLAGRLGVGVTDALVQRRLLSRRTWSHRATTSGGYGVTERGWEFLRGLGVDIRMVGYPTRAFAYPCLDRTEGRPHVAGALGAAIARRLAELGWIRRLPGTRAVKVTPTGRAALRSRLGVEL